MSLTANVLRSILLSITLLALVLLPSLAFAQDFNGKSLKWPLQGGGDERITAFLGSTGYSFGTEGTTVVVENRTDTKLVVTFLVQYTDLCGTTIERKVTHRVGPRAKAGTSAWLDGWDYAPKCDQKKKYADNFYSKLGSVKLQLLSVAESGFTASVGAKGLDCKQLVAYRDETLVNIWDKQRDKYVIHAQQVADLKKMRADLQKQTGTATSNLNLVLLTLKTAANAVEDIISAASPQGHLLSVAKKSGTVAINRVKIYEAVKKGDKTFELLATEDVHKALALQALTELGRLGSIAAFIKNAHDNINSFADYQAVKGEVDKQMAMLNNALSSYNLKLKGSYAGIQELNTYKEFIDTYLKEHCGK